MNIKIKLLTAITARTGISGDPEDLLILDEEIAKNLSFGQGTRALYEMAKLRGKSFVSWAPVQVDTNFENSGKLMIFREYFEPFPCKGEIVYCRPDQKLIEYVKNN
jgi:hypothetical protein